MVDDFAGVSLGVILGALCIAAGFWVGFIAGRRNARLRWTLPSGPFPLAVAEEELGDGGY